MIYPLEVKNSLKPLGKNITIGEKSIKKKKCALRNFTRGNLKRDYSNSISKISNKPITSGIENFVFLRIF